MGLIFTIEHKKLGFLFEAGTSRGVLTQKDAWLLKVYDAGNPTVFGLGEASPLKGLSIDDISDFERKLKIELLKVEDSVAPTRIHEALELAQKVDGSLPSVRFGVETALLDLVYGGVRKHFDNAFYDEGEAIKINGLIWMGDSELMQKRLSDKINEGFRCIKVKIGAINLNQELELLKKARTKFDEKKLELRVDANGAFTFDEAQKVLIKLKELKVHSIEQPIKAGQLEQMVKLCQQTPVPIALDEELIGISSYDDKNQLLALIRPQYIILKPTLLGGFKSCLEWIELAEKYKIGWWITSALESNIGLNAICQFASYLKVTLPQGLGTGSLYSNNIDSPLEVIGDSIRYNQLKKWGDYKAN